jgi:hypothetical protein
MPRELKAIVAHIRAISANPAVSTTLIQTDDLEALCNAAEALAAIDREALYVKATDAIIAYHTARDRKRFAFMLKDAKDEAQLMAEQETYRPYARLDAEAVVNALVGSARGTTL